MDDEQFRYLLRRLDLSWEGYRRVRKGVKRRVARHMDRLGCRTVPEYLDELESSEELRKEALQQLTVRKSRFFRDRQLWRDLENHVFPEILARASCRVKIWSAGCACGEEAYSIAMVWEKVASGKGRSQELELWATDNDPQAMRRAQAGVYRSSSLKEVESDVRKRHLCALNQAAMFAVSDRLKAHIRWQLLDLLSDRPPSDGFWIVFLRNNLLTYYQGEPLRFALRRILDSLLPDGFLIVGSHERIPPGFEDLSPSAFNKLILRKTERTVPCLEQTCW